MKAVGIILAGGNNRRIRELSNKRAVAAMPVAGTYRSIDFALSNMSNSNIKRVAVLTQYNARSLNEHLNSSKWWDFGRKQGGLYIFTPTITINNNNWFRGTADSLYQNLDFLKRSHEPYVVIASGDGIYKIDFNDVLKYHVEKRADVTVVCKEMNSGEDLARFGCIQKDEDGRITEFEEKPVVVTSNIISCGIYVVRRRLLIDLLEVAASEDRYDFVKDVLIRYRNKKKIYAYMHEGYWSNISDLNAYFRTNMDFLKKDVRDYFFRQGEPICSKVDDLPPAKYNPGSYVKNSLISAGCIVNGQVENSVIFKKAFIGNNCIIRNSVILNDVYIADNCCIENCIVEGHSTLRANTNHIGTKDKIKIVVEENDRFVMS